MEPFVERFKAYFRDFATSDLKDMGSLYDRDVVFRDPVTVIQGLDPLQAYFSQSRDGLLQCEFIFDHQAITADYGFFRWVMAYRHRSLRKGALLRLRGTSFIRFHDRIVEQEDCYDLGAMVYEHVPLLGVSTRFIKSRLHRGA